MLSRLEIPLENTHHHTHAGNALNIFVAFLFLPFLAFDIWKHTMPNNDFSNISALNIFQLDQLHIFLTCLALFEVKENHAFSYL
jgi:hypothetical protein